MDVKLPNGKIIKGVPEGTSKEEVARAAIRNGMAKPEDFGLNPQTWEIPGESATGPRQQPVPAEAQVKPRTWVDDALQGAMAVPIMAGAARGAQLLTQGSRVAPYAANLASAVIPQTGRGLAFEGALGAASGVAAGAAERATPEDSALRPVVGPVVGAVTAAPFALGKNAFDLWVSRGMGSELSQTAQGASNVLGQAQASVQAQTALRANPQLGPTVLRAAEIEQQTGISLPMLAAADGDTTISTYLQSQMSRGSNVEFTAALKQQYEAAEKALKAAQRGKTPSMQEVDAYVKKKALEAQQKNTQLVATAQQKAAKREMGLTKIDEAITSLTSKLQAPGNLETGKRLSSLIDAKEAAIRSELSPQYEELLTSAKEMGISLPGDAAKELRNFTSDQLNKDVFQKFPRLYGLIQKEFTTPATTSTKITEKYRVAKQAPVPKDVPLSTLDSLKREVNRSIRDTDNKDDLRRLYLLKDQVETAIDAVDPAFAQAYRALDREYATRLGLPFKEQGVVNINRAKFVEDTVPKMTQNASSLKQTMAIVGDNPEGIQLVKDAFLYDISQNRSIVNLQGQINPAQLKRYMGANKDKIDQVPGLRQELETLGSRVADLQTNRTRILEAQKNDKIATVENLWTKSYGTSDGISGVVRQALNNPQKLDELISITSKDKVAQEGVKAALLNDVLQAQGDRVELFTTNRAAFEKMFGRNETKNIEFIVEASQRLKDNPFKFNINPATIEKTKFEETFGTKPSTSLGEFRNQILSPARVVINHLSRFFQGQSSKTESEEVQKFLLDPKNLELSAQMMAEFETKGFTDKAFNILGKMAKNSGSAYMFGGATGALVGSQQEAAPSYQPDDATLLEGFGQQ